MERNEIPEALEPFMEQIEAYLGAQCASGNAELRELTFGEGVFASEARLFHVTPEIRTHLQGIAHEALHSAYLDAGKEPPKKWPMPLFKLINPQGVIANYSIYSYRKYRDVRTPSKVFAKLQSEKEVLSNLLKREAKKHRDAGGLFSEDIRRQREQIDTLLSAYSPEEEAFEGYEVRIISKKRARYFGDLQWREEGRQKKVQLTAHPRASNIIVYDPALRKTRDVDDFLTSADFNIRDIYVKRTES